MWLDASALESRTDSQTVSTFDVQFEVGDVVDVKGHGRATVIEKPPLNPTDEHGGRYLVRYHEDDTTYWCRPKLIRLMHPTCKRVLVARHTYAYRDAMVHNIERKDVCLEIGCHEGLTTNIISNRATFVTGIDTAPEVVRIASGRHPHISFHVMDGLDAANTRTLSPTGTYTRICIDISGKAPLELICQMILAQRTAFPDAFLIVKNEQLFDALALASASASARPAVTADGSAQACGGGPPPSPHLPPHPHPQPQSQSRAAAHQAVSDQPGSLPEEAASASGTAPTGAGGSALPQDLGAGGLHTAMDTAGGGAEADGAVAAARLLELLGPEVLAECELFRHQFRPPPTRAPRARGTGDRQAGTRQHTQGQLHGQGAVASTAEG